MIHLTHLDQIRSVVVDIRQSEAEGDRGSESVTVIVPGQDGEIPQLAATSTLITVQRLEQRHTQQSTVGTRRSPLASVRLGRLPSVRLGWSPPVRLGRSPTVRVGWSPPLRLGGHRPSDWDGHRPGQTGMVTHRQTGMVTARQTGMVIHRSDWEGHPLSDWEGHRRSDCLHVTGQTGQWTVDNGQWTLGHGEVTCKTLTVTAGTDRLFKTSTTLECRTGQIKLSLAALAETAYPSFCNENQYPFSVHFRIGRTDSRSAVLRSGIGTLTEPFHPSLGGVYWRLLASIGVYWRLLASIDPAPSLAGPVVFVPQ